jgi:LmbE family N-acetylglucosaminyl deacetylase
MRWIYLSTHLDDAVFSAGGLIHDQTQSGTPVEIWTVMAGAPSDMEYSPFAQLLHTIWGVATAEESIRIRREEDKKAATMVGAAILHFDFLDCIYRRDENGMWPYDKITLPPQAMDANLPSQIAETVSSRLMPDDVLVCQLSVGSHVDHVIVRQAAELIGRPLIYDVDVPYIFYKPEELEPKAAGMKESLHSISEAGLKSWQEAAVQYKSQLPSLGEAMETPEIARRSIHDYWSARRGIPLLQIG